MKKSILFTFIHFFILIPVILKGQVNEQDSLALVDLYYSLDGENWNTLTYGKGWLTETRVSNWYGITVENNRVIKIDFKSAPTNFTGTIPSSIGNLTALEQLILSGNRNLTGNIPSEIGNLAALTYLNLSGNGLTGSIPNGLWSLTSLATLNLGGNNLTGTISSNVGNLSNLISLYLDRNQFEGSIPQEITNINTLKYFWFFDNKFDEIPKFQTSINSLYINGNKLDFDDLEQLSTGNLTDFRYYGQEDLILTKSGTNSSIVLSMDAGGTKTTYQWYFENEEITGATSASYMINAANDIQQYLCRAKNSLFPDLTLKGIPPEDNQNKCWQAGTLTFCLTSGTWEKADGSNKIKSSDIVSINDFLCFDGTITIDTTSLELDANGEFYVDDILLPGGNIGKYTLAVGNYNLKLLGEDGQITNFLNSKLEHSAELFGVGLKLDKISFVNESDKTGLSIGCSITVPGILGGCGKAEKKDTEIKLSDFEITSAGLALGGVAVKDMGLMTEGFCLKSLDLSYNSKKNILSAGTMLGLPFGDVGGGFKIEKGALDSIGWHIESNVAPFVIGSTTVGIKGFFGHISSITKPAMEVELGGIFSDILSDDLYRCTLSGTMVWPATIGFKGTGQFMRPIDNSIPYQLQGNTSVAWDVPNSVFKIELGGKFGTLDEKSWLMTGQGKFNIYFKNSPSVLSGKMDGNMKLPKLSDKAPFNWLNSMFDFPVEVKATDRFIYGNTKVAYGEATFKSESHGPYNLRYVIDLTKNVDDEDYLYFEISSGKTKSAIINEKSASTNATVTRTFHVPENNELGVIEVKSSVEAPVSTLTSPTGTSYTKTSSNDNVSYTSSADNKEAFWTLVNATPGTWTIELENPNSEDTIITYFQLKEPELNFTVNQNGNEVNVAWDTESIFEGQMVYVLLDNDNVDFNGFIITEGDASLGTLSFSLDESTPNCNYYVYAQLIDDLKIIEKYADEPVFNPLAALNPPDGFIANYNSQTDEVDFNWSQTSSSDVAGYILTITDEYNNDSVYAVLNSLQTGISLYIDDYDNKTAKIESYDTDGKIGCPSILSSLVTGFENIELETEPDNMLHVYPNPTNGNLTIRYIVSENSRCEIRIFDIYGREVARPLSEFKSAGIHQLHFEFDNLPNGIYLIRYLNEHDSFTIRSILSK